MAHGNSIFIILSVRSKPSRIDNVFLDGQFIRKFMDTGGYVLERVVITEDMECW